MSISVADGGATVNNTGFGQILSDTDLADSDGIAFRGAQFEDYQILATSVFPRPDDTTDFVSAQNISVNQNGQFIIDGVAYDVPANPVILTTQVNMLQLEGIDAPLIMPLVDIAATQAQNEVIFQTDAGSLFSPTNTVFPASIEVPTLNNGVLTVISIIGQPIVITNTNGDPAYNVPQGVDFADTITNSGIIEGDILTGLGDDTVTNTGTLLGDIDLGQGNDTVNAGGNDTVITGGAGDDIIDGGAGVDTAVFTGSLLSYDLTVDNGALEVTDLAGTDGTDTLTNVEFVTFADGTYRVVLGTAGADATGATTGDDLILLLEGDDRVNASNGDDYIFAGIGDDEVIGGAGADYIDGGDGTDEARYANSNAGVTVNLVTDANTGGHAEGDTLLNIENVYGSRFDDVITGDSGDNVLTGFNGNDTLTGAEGINQLNGGNGNDIFIGGTGADVLNGGSGQDTVDYSGSDARVEARLGGSQVFDGGFATGDSFQGLENIIGSNFSDTLVGNLRANELTGNGGNDFLNGDRGNDTLLGGDGNDTLIGGFGRDIIDGGDGIDTARYANANSRAVVDLSMGTGSAGHSFGDVISNVENLFGSNFNDVFTGDAGDNVLNGWNGVDRLTGGEGNDTLIGGAGNDRFIFTDNWDNDTITDFEDGGDLMDFRTVTGVDDINDLTIFNDVNGNAVVSFNGDSITLIGIDEADITAADFLF